MVRHLPIAGIVLMLVLGAAARPANAQHAEPPAVAASVASALARAEAAFDRGDTPTAEREYAAVLTEDPRHSRALYRLAQLRRDVPGAAVPLLQTYVQVVPADAWGHLALAHALARDGRPEAALAAYDRALALEPDDRDIRLGRPRLLDRLGRSDAAIAAFDEWLAANPSDEEVWRELAMLLQRTGRPRAAMHALERALRANPGDPALNRRVADLRVRTAPVIQTGALVAGETGVTTTGMTLTGDVALAGAARLGASYQRRRVSGLADAAATERFGLSLSGRPSADLQVNATGVVARTPQQTAGAPTFRPEAAFRLRRLRRGNGTALDVRIQRDAIEATPEFVRMPVLRTQTMGSIDAPLVGWWRFRAQTRIASLAREEEQNRRTLISAGTAVDVSPHLRVTGQWQQLWNSNPAVRGYFAPARVQVADAGIEFERDFARAAVAFDAGAGIQRLRRAGEPALGAWAPSLRLWGSVGWNLTPRQQLLLEIETYDSHLAETAVPAERWRYASLTASLRFHLP